MLRSFSGSEVSFYAHAKGVSPRYHAPDGLQIGRIRRWRDFMYRFCLEAFPRDALDKILRRAACAGTLKRFKHYRQEQGRPPCPWHYSGNFYWFHHAYFFPTPGALDLGPSRFALERHLGELFPSDQAYCFAGDHMERMKRYSYHFSDAQWDALEAQSFAEVKTKCKAFGC